MEEASADRADGRVDGGSSTGGSISATPIVLALARPMACLTLVNSHILVPVVTVLALIGEFGDVVVAPAFAIIGYLMIRFQYPRITFTIPN